MNKDKLKSEILEAENNLLSALRQGELIKGVSLHLNSPEYKNIWNGEIKTYEMLESRIRKAIENGLKSFDYKVNNREFMFINSENVIETFTAVETDHMADGSTITSGLTAISILWQLIDHTWRVAYLHASELPKETD